MTKLEPAGVGSLDEQIDKIFNAGDKQGLDLDQGYDFYRNQIKQILAEQRSLVINEVLSGLPKEKTGHGSTSSTRQYSDRYLDAYNDALTTIKQQLEGLNGGGK